MLECSFGAFVEKDVEWKMTREKNEENNMETRMGFVHTSSVQFSSDARDQLPFLFCFTVCQNFAVSHAI